MTGNMAGHWVLRQGGYACIRNGTRESDFPHRYFFPTLLPLIESDLPLRRGIKAVFQRVALRLSFIKS